MTRRLPLGCVHRSAILGDAPLALGPGTGPFVGRTSQRLSRRRPACFSLLTSDQGEHHTRSTASSSAPPHLSPSPPPPSPPPPAPPSAARRSRSPAPGSRRAPSSASAASRPPSRAVTSTSISAVTGPTSGRARGRRGREPRRRRRADQNGFTYVCGGTAPTATLSGGGTVCAGQSATLSVALTGTGPWSSSGPTASPRAASPPARPRATSRLSRRRRTRFSPSPTRPAPARPRARPSSR